MAEIAPPPQPRETLPSPEVRFQEGLVGLQARLLIATPESLNPDSTLPAVTRDALGSLDGRNYGVFNNASTGERQDYWRGKEGDVFDRQKAAWITSTVATFTNDQAQRFFQDDQGKSWSETFAKLGITTQGFNQQAAEQLYATYFTDGKSDIKKFVKDCIDKNATEDLTAIQWIANIFGKESSEVVAQLVAAEKKLKDHPDQLVKEANEEAQVNNQPTGRVNRLEQRERELLNFFSRHHIQPTTTPQATPPTDGRRQPTDQHDQPPQHREQIIPNISPEANREGAEQMIRTLRDPSRYNRLDNSMPERHPLHDLGHVTLRSPFETSWFSPYDFNDLAQERYHVPMAIYAQGDHALLVLQGPHRAPDGTWRIRTFNPFNQGEIEQPLRNFDNWEAASPMDKFAMLGANGIFANNLASSEIYQNNYDISISNNPALDQYRQMFLAGKLPRYQYNDRDCVPYTFFANVLLQALKQRDTEFKTQGLAQFEQDFGMHIRTLEEIMGTQMPPTPDRVGATTP